MHFNLTALSYYAHNMDPPPSKNIHIKKLNKRRENKIPILKASSLFQSINERLHVSGGSQGCVRLPFLSGAAGIIGDPSNDDKAVISVPFQRFQNRSDVTVVCSDAVYFRE